MSTVAARKLRSPYKTHGGKSYLARRIIALFPPHQCYVEPFIGGGSILLNKKPAMEEAANDINRDLIRTYRAMQEYPTAILSALETTPYSAEVFGSAVYAVNSRATEDDVEFAIQYIIKNRMSRGGLGKDFAWSDRLRGGQPGDVNAWETSAKEFPLVVDRLRGVRFTNLPAVQVIRDYDSADSGTLFYCDPPYLPSTRSVPKAYAHEMTRDQHVELLDCLKACRCSVVLSGYRSDLYDSALEGWRRVDIEIANNSGQGKTKQRRVECVWLNFAEGTPS